MNTAPRGKFRQSVRIKREAEISRLLKTGHRWECPVLRIYFLKNGLQRSRFGIVVSKSAGSAVVRNKIKRTVREFFRKQDCAAARGLDILVRYRARQKRITDRTLERNLQQWYQGLEKRPHGQSEQAFTS